LHVPERGKELFEELSNVRLSEEPGAVVGYPNTWKNDLALRVRNVRAK
jgi:hypothetical protein